MGGRITPPRVGVSRYFRNSISGVLNTIVTPAANVAGIRLAFALIVNDTGGQPGALLAKSSAPASVGDTSAISILVANGGNISSRLAFEVVVPPGLGLYEQAGASGTSTTDVSYEVL